jgi:hypothetical protein
MNEQLQSIKFDNNVTAETAMRSVRERGACAIYNFAPHYQLRAAAEVLSLEAMLHDKADGDVPRDQELSFYAFAGSELLPIMPTPGQEIHGIHQAPAIIHNLARNIALFVELGGLIPWQPNEVIGHRYGEEGFIGPHRDYKAAAGVVAVLTLEGEQDLHVELDRDRSASTVRMVPGTLTLLRGYNGLPDNRPRHWVDAPVTATRRAMSVRQMNPNWSRTEGSGW